MVQIRKRDKNNNLIWWGSIRRKLLFRSSAPVSSRTHRRNHNKESNSSIIVLHTNDGNFSEEELNSRTSDNIVDGSEFLLSRDHIAAVTIQTCFRAHLARRALRALKSLVKLQALVRGVVVRRQARIALSCMNALARLQITVRARQLAIDQPSSS